MVRSKACKIRKAKLEWAKITSDKLVLSIVEGIEIPFISAPAQFSEPCRTDYTSSEISSIDNSISTLLKSGAIVKSNEEAGQFISTVFTVPKPDGSRRPILNLKKLNLFVKSPHFKMETIKTAAEVISQNCFMVVIYRFERCVSRYPNE